MYFKYKVTFQNAYDNEEKTHVGLICAANYGEAANKLIEIYELHCIIDVYLCDIDSAGTGCLTLEELALAFKE